MKSGLRVQGGDEIGGGRDPAHALAAGLRDLLKSPVPEFGEMVPNDFRLETIAFAQPLELYQKAFAQVARADPDRIKRPDQSERPGHRLDGKAAPGGNLLVARPQKAFLVYVADNLEPGAPDAGFIGRESQLLLEVLREIFGFGVRVKKELPPLFVLRSRPRARSLARKIRPRVLIDLPQLGDLRIERCILPIGRRPLGRIV